MWNYGVQMHFICGIMVSKCIFHIFGCWYTHFGVFNTMLGNLFHTYIHSTAVTVCYVQNIYMFWDMKLCHWLAGLNMQKECCALAASVV